MKVLTTKRHTLDAEQKQFAADVLESIGQAQRGEYAAVHTPAQITARKRGRPVGSVKADAKQPVKIRIDPDVLAALREAGEGWQTRINDMLRASLRLSGRL